MALDESKNTNWRDRALRLFEATKNGVSRLINLYRPRTWKQKGLAWSIGLVFVTLVVVFFFVGVYWSQEPDQFDVNIVAKEDAAGDNRRKHEIEHTEFAQSEISGDRDHQQIGRGADAGCHAAD